MTTAEHREERLLLACARPRVDARSQATIAELSAGDINWTELVALALHHQVTPALLTAFTEPSTRSLVPGDILTALQRYGDAARQRSAYLAAELCGILSALAEEEIPAMPFKGPVLAETVYGDLGQRPPGDLDFLVRPRDVTRVCDVLVSRGYRDAASTVPMTATQHRMYRRYQCEYQFIRDRDGVVTEPHWALTQRMRAVDSDYEAQFARARPMVFCGARIIVHAPEDLILLLCIHGAKHEWERLGWIRDFAAILERSADLDLDLAVARARTQGCLRLLLLGMEVAHQLLDAPLSPSHLRAVRSDPGVAPLANHVLTHLFLRDRPLRKASWLNGFGFGIHERVANRVGYVARTLLLPRREHIEMVALPASLAWLYYPLRWGHDYVGLPLWNLCRRRDLSSIPALSAPDRSRRLRTRVQGGSEPPRFAR